MNYLKDLTSNPRMELLFRFRPHGHAYRCYCGQPVFFRNTQCLGCGGALGYDSHEGRLLSLEPGKGERLWREAGLDQGKAPLYRRCNNLESPAACNWLIPAESPDTLCIACTLNRTIPNLASQQNQEYWRKIENAKRRMVAQLLLMGLPVIPKSQDEQRGMAFDFVEQLPGEKPVMTGHQDGLITINVAEADDANREALREQLREAYRTVLGHLRHESGHYYWDLLVRNSAWLGAVRARFGDETRDYQAALETHYRNAPPSNWQQTHISTYATSHAWEDWAETWAHYLHMTDAVNTAMDFGIDTSAVEPPAIPFTQADLHDPGAADADDFLAFINLWVALTGVTNELARSMGHRDLYPFVIASPVVAKLQLVHLIVNDAARRAPN